MLLQCPSAVPYWIHGIGAYNASFISRLTVTLFALESRLDEDSVCLGPWLNAFKNLPNLQRLTFDYDPDQHTLDTGSSQAKSTTETTEIQKFSLTLRQRPISHAVLAIDEHIPSVLDLYFAKLLKLSTKISLEENITSLPRGFLPALEFQLSREYTFTEHPEKPTVTLTYTRQSGNKCQSYLDPNHLHDVLTQLPRLLYLRLGCRHVDSSFLASVPAGLQTLDVAFTDDDPTRIARNLRLLRDRCDQLFTLAIVVSPLHDSQISQAEETLTGSQTASEEATDKWEPYREAIAHLQSTGVRVWEGEGPGFRRDRQ